MSTHFPGVRGGPLRKEKVARARLGLPLLALLAVLVLGACAQSGSPRAYHLTDSQQDAEYLLDWETVGETCPATAEQAVLEGFVHRGEEVEVAPGERMTVPGDSPSLWGSTRLLREGDPNTGNYRSLSIEVTLLESDAALQDMVAAAEQIGVSVTGDPIASGVAESPLAGGSSVVGVAAGHRLMVRIGSLSAGQMTAYCDHDEVQALVDAVAGQLGTVLPGDV